MNILLTFDYEVFFGENFYSEEEVLFRPTEKLLAIAKKHNAKLVFFIDICSIVAYEKFGRMEYVNNFQKQIYKILELGHDVQMHFHPHWFDSIYNMSSNSWHHNYKNWSYSNLIDNYGLTKANEMFGLAQRKFIDLVGSKPLSFRAGGYTTQPHEEALISLLKRFDYKYDSSITPLKMFHSSAQWFDYMEAPDLNYWEVDNSSFLKMGDSGLIEVPVFALERSGFLLYKYYMFKLANRFFSKPKFEKKGVGATITPDFFQNKSLSFSFDNAKMSDKEIVKLLIKEHMRKNKGNSLIVLNILSHPKIMYEECLDVFDWFLSFARDKYNCKFIGFDNLKEIM